jgi:hypothetical protein
MRRAGRWRKRVTSNECAEDQGKEWRWPKKESKEQQDLEEVLSAQKANARVCSNAAALVDECEEELCKFDSWLVSLAPLPPPLPTRHPFALQTSRHVLSSSLGCASPRDIYAIPHRRGCCCPCVWFGDPGK